MFQDGARGSGVHVELVEGLILKLWDEGLVRDWRGIAEGLVPFLWDWSKFGRVFD